MTNFFLWWCQKKKPRLLLGSRIFYRKLATISKHIFWIQIIIKSLCRKTRGSRIFLTTFLWTILITAENSRPSQNVFFGFKSSSKVFLQKIRRSRTFLITFLLTIMSTAEHSRPSQNTTFRFKSSWKAFGEKTRESKNERVVNFLNNFSMDNFDHCRKHTTISKCIFWIQTIAKSICRRN